MELELSGNAVWEDSLMGPSPLSGHISSMEVRHNWLSVNHGVKVACGFEPTPASIFTEPLAQTSPLRGAMDLVLHLKVHLKTIWCKSHHRSAAKHNSCTSKQVRHFQCLWAWSVTQWTKSHALTQLLPFLKFWTISNIVNANRDKQCSLQMFVLTDSKLSTLLRFAQSCGLSFFFELSCETKQTEQVFFFCLLNHLLHLLFFRTSGSLRPIRLYVLKHQCMFFLKGSTVIIPAASWPPFKTMSESKTN